MSLWVFDVYSGPIAFPPFCIVHTHPCADYSSGLLEQPALLVYNASTIKYFGGRGTALPDNPKKSCIDAALGYLTARMRSTYEMRNYLHNKGYTEEDIDITMVRLNELGFINDEQFTSELVRAKTAIRPIGRRALSYALQQKGIAKECAEQGLSQYSREDEQKACFELFAKLAQKHGMDAKGYGKIQRALVSRGFGYDTIQQAASQFKERDEWE